MPAEGHSPGQPIVSNASLRDIRFDLLKCIALVCIVLAHVDPPKWLLQARNFDVPLMVLIGGAVYVLTSARRPLTYPQYLRRRVLRLIVPTWAFFAVYYLASVAFARTFHVPLPFTVTDVLGEILLIGNGYAWIIRVFILVALAAPFLLRYKQHIKSESALLLLVCTVLLAYQAIVTGWSALRISPDAPLSIVVTRFFFEPIVYGSVFALGMCIPSMTRKTAALFALGFLITWLAIAAWLNHFTIPPYHQIVWTQVYKYPPQLYYILYALAISFALFALLYKLRTLPAAFQRFIGLMSEASLWVYLWHIFFLSLFKHVWATDHRIEKFLLVLPLALVVTFVQRQFISILIGRLGESHKASAGLLRYGLA